LRCIKCEMIRLEVTIRGTTAGHYVRRNPKVTEGIDRGPVIPLIRLTLIKI
jgi:hypothetical protein